MQLIKDGAGEGQAGGDDRRRHQRRAGAGAGRRRRGDEHRHAGGQGGRQHGRPRLQPDQAARGRRGRQAAADDPRLPDHVLDRQRRGQVLRHPAGDVRGRLPGDRAAQRHAPGLAAQRHPLGGDLQRHHHHRCSSRWRCAACSTGRSAPRRCCGARCSSTASAASSRRSSASSSSTWRWRPSGWCEERPHHDGSNADRAVAPRSSPWSSPGSSTRSP